MSKKKFDFDLHKKEKVEVNDESILNVLQKKSMRNKEICDKLNAKSNLVSYHLRKLVKSGRIEKKGELYSIVAESPTKLHELIFTILEENDCDSQKLEEISKKLKKSNSLDSISSNDELKKILDEDLKYSLDKVVDGGYKLNSYLLRKREFCFVCKKRITDSELKIGMLTFGPWDGTDNWPIHATCRHKLHQPVDESDTICNYCGLDLKRYFRDPSKITPSLDAALAKLYDDPFSQIFSHLDTEYYQPPDPDIDHVFGFTHYKEKDGKKYHPYCMKIIKGEISND